MQILIIMIIVLTAIGIVLYFRINRDREELTARVLEQGGEVRRVVKLRSGKGSPFTDTGRGWWAWRIDWRHQSQDKTSWALTTREGIKEWRD